MVPHGDRVFIWNDHGDLILARLTAAGYQEISRAHILDPDMPSAGGRGARLFASGVCQPLPLRALLRGLRFPGSKSTS
jgi:hypothetical protein